MFANKNLEHLTKLCSIARMRLFQFYLHVKQSQPTWASAVRDSGVQ